MYVPPAAATHRRLMRMPEEVAALRKPWPRLAGLVPGLTEEMEDEFRFGHTVVRLGDRYRMGGSIKGGSSSIWVTVDDAALASYDLWSRVEGPEKNEDAEAFTELTDMLGEHGILVASQPDEYLAVHGGAYRKLLEILRALPGEHIDRLALESIRVGGWGPDAAKASAYRNGMIYLYDFAVNGAARTLGGLILHELGHAFHESLGARESALVSECHEEIGGRRAFIGLEYLLDSDSRKVYQEFIPDEFAAESYLLYTACGSMLREFIREQEGAVAEAWWEMYTVLNEGFGGTGYI